MARCRKLATFSEDAGGTRRTFLSAPMRDCHREVSSWMKSLGMSVSVDAAGNLRGFYAGASPSAPRILIGSHLDTVPNAGAFDGILGVVEGIVGQNRLEFTFLGQANHAGTTPMNLRRDALAAAVEWIVAVENLARRTADLVATVGFVEAKPGATNVIAGEARATLDIRHASDRARTEALDELIRQAESIAARRGVTVKWRTLLAQNAVAMDPFLTEQVEQAIHKTGCEPHLMASGAGHDAMILAEKIPTAMIFLRTPGGISHDPAESVHLDDVAKALECGHHLLTQLAASQEFLGRTCRA